MKNLSVFILGLLCLFVLFACTEQEPLDPVGDPVTSFEALYKQEGVKAQTFTIDAEIGGSFTAAQGMVVEIPPATFRSFAGDTIRGPVTIEFKEYLNVKDMIISGLNTNHWRYPLVSGGSLFIGAKQGEEQLAMDYFDTIQVFVPIVTRAEGFEDRMMAFRGTEMFANDSIPFLWGLTSEIPLTQEERNRSMMYRLPISELGYHNCDAFYRIPGDVRSRVSAKVEGAATGTSRILMLVKDYTIAVDLFWDGEVKETGADLPTGLEIRLIAINVDEEELKFGVLDAVNEENTTYEVEVKPGTMEELKALLENPY